MMLDRDFKPVVRPLEAFPSSRTASTGSGCRTRAVLPRAGGSLAGGVLHHYPFQRQHTIADVQAAFVKKFGQAVAAAQIGQLIRQLDEPCCWNRLASRRSTRRRSRPSWMTRFVRSATGRFRRSRSSMRCCGA